jgi:hypothetical protein
MILNKQLVIKWKMHIFWNSQVFTKKLSPLDRKIFIVENGIQDFKSENKNIKIVHQCLKNDYFFLQYQM